MPLLDKVVRKETKKIYIAGKITGNNDYKEKFGVAEQNIIYDINYNIVKRKNESWLKKKPYNELTNIIFLNHTILPSGMEHSDYMTIRYAMIDVADIVYFLPDWKESKGAMLEMQHVKNWNSQVVIFGKAKIKKEIRYL